MTFGRVADGIFRCDLAFGRVANAIFRCNLAFGRLPATIPRCNWCAGRVADAVWLGSLTPAGRSPRGSSAYGRQALRPWRFSFGGQPLDDVGCPLLCRDGPRLRAHREAAVRLPKSKLSRSKKARRAAPRRGVKSTAQGENPGFAGPP